MNTLPLMIERIRTRLTSSAYVNEAAISHGVVTPILSALGWDIADPDQMVPEYAVEGGRVDFALLGLGRRPVVFIEVKAVGRALDGDRQLFAYAFKCGVPLCILTDGREWSFYLPSGQGSYEDRRLYRLQLDDRDLAECERVLNRYLSRERVRDGSAFEDAQRDHRDAAGKREALTYLPRAWAELVAAPEDLLVDLLSERAEQLCGFRPSLSEAVTFLQRLRPAGMSPPPAEAAPTAAPAAPKPSPFVVEHASSNDDRTIEYRLLGEPRSSPNAGIALVDILRVISARDPARIAVLADVVRGDTRSPIATSPAQIHPTRPDLQRNAEFAPGWLVGLHTSNKGKLRLIRAACEVYGLRMPDDLDIQLPNT